MNIFLVFLFFLLSIPVFPSEHLCGKFLSEVGWSAIEDTVTHGSTGGRWYESGQSRRIFVKTDQNFQELQSSAEVIGSLVYREFGYQTPATRKYVDEGKHLVAVDDIGSDTKPTALDHENSPKVRQLRVVAAFLADYDRIANRSNNRLHEDGSMTLIDFGGTLGSKASGKHKDGEAFSDQIGALPIDASIHEIMTGVPLQYFSRGGVQEGPLVAKPISETHPWRLLTEEDVDAVVLKFKGLTDVEIERIVRKAGYSRTEDQEFMISALKNRRDTIVSDLKRYHGLMKNGEVSDLDWYSSRSPIETRDSNLDSEQKFAVYKKQAKDPQLVYAQSERAIWRHLGNLELNSEQKRELFLDAVKLESGAINSLDNIFSKDELSPEFVQGVVRSLQDGNYRTTYHKSMQEGGVHELERFLALIRQLSNEGISYGLYDLDSSNFVDTSGLGEPLGWRISDSTLSRSIREGNIILKEVK